MKCNIEAPSFNSRVKIGDYSIGADAPPFIIAEMSGNHNKSLERALAIVDAAADSGVHGLKIQTYTPDTMTIDLDEKEFRIGGANSLWEGRSLYKLYEDAHTPWDWHKPLFEHAIKKGLIPFSTPFDQTAVEFLEKLDVPCYKIASFENTDLPLIRSVASTGKPLMVSCGMATLAELDECVQTAVQAGCKDLILLKCTSTYPSSPENTNIRTIQSMRENFGCQVGLSDHTVGIGVAVASVVLGATVIEKHFTLDRSDGGVDSAFSMEPSEMAQLVNETRHAWQSLGRVAYGPIKEEKDSIQFRRSLYVVEDLKEGDKLSRKNVRAIRPGYGLPVKYLEKIIGMTIKYDIKRGTALNWGLLK